MRILLLHTYLNTFTYWKNIFTARLREVGRLCMTTYYFNILTYWNLYCYIPLINKAFEPISCFTYSVSLLPEYCINKGIRSYLLADIKLRTPEIKLRTILIFLHTDRKLLHTQEIF